MVGQQKQVRFEKFSASIYNLNEFLFAHALKKSNLIISFGGQSV